MIGKNNSEGRVLAEYPLCKKAITGVIMCFVVFSLNLVVVNAQKENFDVSFEVENQLSGVCIYADITNLQDNNDDFPIETLLKDTSLNLPYADVEYYRWKVTERFNEKCNVCEFQICNTDLDNVTVCDYVNKEDCYECGVYNESEMVGGWEHKNIINHNNDGYELRNSFEEIHIKKGETEKLKICYDFGEIPLNPLTNKPGSFGFLYLKSNNDLYYDFENSSWWNTSLEFNRSIHNIDGYADPFLINDNPVTLCDLTTCWDVELWANKECKYLYYNNNSGVGFPDAFCVDESQTSSLNLQIAANTTVINVVGNPFNRHSLVVHCNDNDFYDSSMNNHTVTIVGDPSVYDTEVGFACAFDGDDAISYASSVQDGDEITIILYNNRSGIDDQYPGGARPNGASSPYNNFEYDGSNKMRFNVVSNSVFISPVLTTPAPANAWQHVAWNMSLSEQRGYGFSYGVMEVNGTAGISNFDTSHPFVFGRLLGNNYIVGSMTKIILANVTFNETVVNAIYSNVNGTLGYSTFGAEESRPEENTSVLAVNFEIVDFNFTSSIFVEGIEIEFNTSVPNVEITILSSMNIEKISGTGTNNVFSQISLDNVTLATEVLRSITGTGTIGSVALNPLSFNVASSGSHTLIISFARDGNGLIGVSNIDVNLVKFITPLSIKIPNFLFDTTFTHTALDFVQAFNFTLNKTILSRTYFSVKQTIVEDSPTTTTCTYFLNDTSENHISPFWARFLNNQNDIGAILGTLIDNPESGVLNYSVMAKQTRSGTTITSNITMLIFDMRTENNETINGFQVSNTSTNLTNSVDFGEGTHLITSKVHQLLSGNGLLLTASSSFGTNSGTQTPTYFINSSDISEVNCSSDKQRSLTNVNDIGNVMIYTICKGLTESQTYQFDLWLVVESGQTVTQLDESFNGFEISSFDTSTGNSPPIPGIITNPEDGETVELIDLITWTQFIDPNGNNVKYNVTLRFSNSTFVAIIGDNITGLNVSVNWSVYNDGNYILTVEACDPATECSNTSNDIIILTVPPTIPSSITFCQSSDVLLIRTVTNENNNGVINLTIKDVTVFCLNGCSNVTWSTLGNPGCIEPDMQLWIIFIVVSIIGVLIIRGVWK